MLCRIFVAASVQQLYVDWHRFHIIGNWYVVHVNLSLYCQFFHDKMKVIRKL